MILDKENLVSYKQAITVSAASTDVIDLGPPMGVPGGAGSDKPLPVMMAVDEVFASGGATTLLVEIQSSPVAGFGSGVVTHWSRLFTKAELIQTGNLGLSANIPQDVQRYVRANYTVATGPFTAGKLTLGLVAGGRQINR